MQNNFEFYRTRYMNEPSDFLSHFSLAILALYNIDVGEELYWKFVGHVVVLPVVLS